MNDCFSVKDLDSYIDSCDALVSEDALVESNLNRVLSYDGFFIVSASRSENSEEENKNNTTKLRHMLESKHLGYVELNGGWVDPETNEDTQELSILVPYPSNYDFGNERFLKIAKYLARYFKQWSFMYKDLDTGIISEYETVDNDHSDYEAKLPVNTNNLNNKFHINDNARGYSKLKKHGSQSKLKFTSDISTNNLIK